MGVRKLEQAGIAILILTMVALPTAIHGWPTSAAGNVSTAALLASGLTLVWWRSHPRLVAVLGGAFWLLFVSRDAYGYLPGTPFMVLLATVTALGWSGRAAWLVALCLGVYLFVFWGLRGTTWVAVVMLSIPGFFAGTVLRLCREAADGLAVHGRELEEERELFADLALRHERTRIASELHDIVGHAISVMVVQAAAGQQLVDNPARARQTFTAIAESARQGKEDLQRLIELLGGTEVAGSELSLIEEVVARATRGGLDVSCRFEGERDSVAAPTAHIAFRIVQESLTNALRYAPGAAVWVLVSRSGRGLTVSVENDRSVQERPGLSGTGRGLVGLRERVQELGGHLLSGPTSRGGWLVEATLPNL
ncbi:sensor histidine kinase [Frankia sp. CiP3]|uniref:sensor histidine kinase n=1 Tax=Frankia sp. CiP3 TaxID=2880971 RepID=UPI001EF62ADE|nr:histidine kinase [Frankia sp. CiP3]